MSTALPSLSDEVMAEIRSHAERDYPAECCGLLFSRRSAYGIITTVKACRNVQNENHSLDPEVFPRTADHGYYMAPDDLLAAQKEAREKGEILRMIYHSHIDAGAYFSEEDSRSALYEGEPLYPGVDYLVLSVLKGRAAAFAVFRWNPQSLAFTEICRRNLS